MSLTTPPFHADHVGSLLRSDRLKEARRRYAEGDIGHSEFKQIEDAAVADAIKKQEQIGLRSITDGELRRAFWNYDFLEHLDGIESSLDYRKGFQFKQVAAKPKMLRIVGKIGQRNAHPMVEHFRFAHATTKLAAKMTIPSPSTLHFRFGRASLPETIYPSLDEFHADLAAAYRRIIADFYEAGCRYLQLDDVYLAYLCDPEQCDALRARGDDPDALPGIYAELINAALSEVRDDMTVAMHLCRGNFRSSHVAKGGYEPIADLLFNNIDIDAYFMEFDTERAGGFEPLRFLPKDKTVVLGLVTSKTGQIEDKDTIKYRIDDAAKVVPLRQLRLSPQCGFASTEEGNTIAQDEQWRKLAFVVELADEVWGR